MKFFDFGLFKTLPESIMGIFTRNAALQYIALGLLAAALIAKTPIGRAFNRQEAEKRI